MSYSLVPTSVPVVILKTSADWDAWITFIRINAQIEGVWDLMNPNLATEPHLPKEPARPLASSVKHGAYSEADLDEKQLKLLERKENNYYKDMAVYMEKMEPLKQLQRLVVATVAPTNLMYAGADETNTPYKLLLALKKRLAPTSN